MPKCHFFFCQGISKDNHLSVLQTSLKALEINPTCRTLKSRVLSDIVLVHSDDILLEETADGFTLSFGLTQEERATLRSQNFVEGYNWASTYAEKNQWLYLFHHKTKKETWLLSDRTGAWPVFIHHENERLTLSSEPQPLIVSLCDEKKALKWNREAILEFLSFGVTLDSKTLFQEISLLPQNTYLHFKEGYLKTVSPSTYGKKNTSLSLEEKLEKFHSLFTIALEDKFNFESLTHMTLTGGSDSRLMLFATPEHVRNQTTYWFDHECGISHEEAQEELEAIQPLVEKFRLNFHLGYPDQKGFPSFLTEQSDSDRYRAFDADFHGKTLTGIYGTELLSGACLSLKERFQTKLALEDELTTSAKTLLAETKLKFCNQLLENEISSLAPLTYRSFLTDLYQSPIWGNPWVQAKRKPTPFLHPEIVSFLFSLNSSDLKDYHFTYHYLKKFFPEALKSPFASSLNFHYELPKLKAKQTPSTVTKSPPPSPILSDEDSIKLGEILCELEIFDRSNIKKALNIPELQYRYFLLSRWYLLNPKIIGANC